MKNQPPQRVIDRLNGSMRPAEEWSDCVESIAGVGSHGYPHFSWSDGERSYNQTAHRIAWFDAYGPIPDGLTVDHMCHNQRCVNIDHLRLLTPSENAKANVYAARTQCPAGHPYDEVNTYRQPSKPNARRCRKCAKEADARRIR